jgi:beta-glucanase (GH16 family)
MCKNRSIYLVLAAACMMIFGASHASAKPYKGAEIYSADTTKYGRYVMRMRMAKGSGVLSTFFTYKNGSEITGTLWEEIDIEVLGKNDAYQVQSNIIVGSPSRTTEGLHTASQSLANDYHTYALEWTPDYVAWFLDGQEIRRINGGNFVTSLINPQSMRFNIWASTSEPWVGAFNPGILPVYQFVNYMEYYAYNTNTRSFTFSWRDDFNSFDTNRWSKADWTFDGNYVDFDPANVVIQNGTLILALTNENSKGFSGTVPVDGGASSRSSSSVAISSSISSSIASSKPSSSAISSAISSSSSSITRSSSSAASGGQCNWYGSLYPLCVSTNSGWGYENNRSCITSSTCASQPAPFGIVGSPAQSSSPQASSRSSSSSSAPSSSVRSSVASSASSANNSGGLSCTAKVVNNWGSGYQLDVSINNGSSATVNGWNVTLSFNENPQRTGGWNATFGGSGNTVTAGNVNWNGSVAPGQSVAFGLQGNHNGNFTAPSCRVN